MKSNLLSAIRLTVVCLILFAGVYPLLVLGIAQTAPNRGKGEIITSRGKSWYGNVGQSFTEDRYFWSRPSAAGYNAAGSAGSNKGPSNPEYLQEVRARIDSFLVHNPGIEKREIPVDLVTASGSGLDPNISVKAAMVQVKRIAKVRKISENRLRELVMQYTEKPVLGIFGPEKVNVLRLNVALEQTGK